MGAVQPPAPPPANRRLWVVIGVLGGLLAIAVILIGVFWPRGGPFLAATDAPTPAAVQPSTAPTDPASEPPAAGTSGGPVTPTAPTEPGTPQPSSCDDLYSPALVTAFGDMVLNPAWLDDPDLDMKIGADDPVLQGVVDDNESLLCQWGKPEGPSGAGVSTTVVWVDAADRATVQSHLEDRGDSCYDQRNGVRCTTEGSNDEGYFGESNFLRDGIWVATEYSNAGPEGYTLDIVDNLWPTG